ncbi:hypothetical protein Ahy_B04g071929 [Arachis hypogaea]|uniref:PB1-like domain-containing protein n=1 Tax=Arachis hypogaea TaxID=3818 RepID=A0A444ZM77_ARAHY|nr:hypothetical protein Ahy_B04g071929 [Arachis hypogaea]
MPCWSLVKRRSIDLAPNEKVNDVVHALEPLKMMDVLLDIMFHHGGNFEKDDEEKLRYTHDKLTCLGDLDEDTLDVFFIRNYYKELGYDKILHCWWLVPRRTLETRLRNLNSDDELREMCFLAHKNNGLVDVYFEHGVLSPDYLQDQEKKVGMNNTEVNVAEEEGATVTPNDKTRNPSNQSPQNKPTPVNTIDIPNPPINPIPPTNPTPPTKPKSLTNPKSPSQEKPHANPKDQSQAKPPNNQKPKLPTNPKSKPPTNQKPKPTTNSKPKPPTKPILPKSVRLEKVRKESKHWHPIWTSDTGYEKFEVHGYPANHVVDLGKHLCTCQFWMLTG